MGGAFRTAAKAAAFFQIDELINNATYLYSTNNDVHGTASADTDIEKWDYFYSPFKIENSNPNESYSIRFAVKETVRKGNQLYDMKLKKASLDLDNRLLSKVIGVSSDASLNNCIPSLTSKSNTVNKNSVENATIIPFVTNTDDTLEMYPGRFTTNTETKLVNEVGTEETKKVLNEEIKNIDDFVEKISEKRSLEEARERYVNNEAFERELFPE